MISWEVLNSGNYLVKKCHFFHCILHLAVYKKNPVVSLPLREAFFAFYGDMKYQHFHLQIQNLVLKSRVTKLLKRFIMQTILIDF